MTYKSVMDIVVANDVSALRFYKDKIKSEAWKNISLCMKFNRSELREFQNYIDFDIYFKWNGITEEEKKEFNFEAEED